MFKYYKKIGQQSAPWSSTYEEDKREVVKGSRGQSCANNRLVLSVPREPIFTDRRKCRICAYYDEKTGGIN